MKSACAFLALAALLASAVAQPTMLRTGGAAPDVVALYFGTQWIGSTSATSIVNYQDSMSRADAQSGAVLSHTCNADGSFDAVWMLNDYNSSALITRQLPYCEHGQVLANGTYMSYYQQTTTCPMSAPYDSAMLRVMNVVPGTNLGALTGVQFCNPNFPMSLLHASSAMPQLTPGAAPANTAAGRKLL